MSAQLYEPVKLAFATAWRTYMGGSNIRALHGQADTEDDYFPEEWIMSTVRARNSGREHIVEGQNMLADSSMSFAQLIEENPVAMLGQEHYDAYGAQLGVLVKLIDSYERLTVQVHPTREMARKLFNSEFGKTECWHVLGGRTIDGEEPCIYFGFKPGITREYWKDCFDRQDIPAMLDCLHKWKATPGETYFIEGGIPHAIGAGCFLVELQEPTDYTIRVEQTTPKGLAVADFMCHQGLGFERMFDCFTYTGYTREEVEKRWKIPQKGNVIIDSRQTDMFQLNRITVSGETQSLPCGDRFSGIFVLSGEGTLNGKPICKGDQYFIPAACAEATLTGTLDVLQFFGPQCPKKKG